MTSVRLFLKLPNVPELRRGMFSPSASNRVRSGNGGKVIEPKIDKLLDQLFKAKQNFFISGPAGVGKSYLLQYMKNYAKENDIRLRVTALTGNAAILINGKPLHSWASIGLGDDTAERLLTKVRKNFASRKNWFTTDIFLPL